MKKWLLVVTLLSLTCAEAQTLNFGDLNYFLQKGQKNITADVNLHTYQVEQVEGTTYQQWETEGYYVTSRLAFGISDRLTGFLALDYDYDAEVTDETTKGNRKYTNSGLRNPGLGASYRLLSQTEGLLNIDLGTIVSVGLEDAERGSTSASGKKDGNAANGRDSFEVNARVGRKWNEANEWQAGMGFIYHASGEHKELSAAGPSEKFKDNSSVDMYLRAAYQYYPLDEFMMSFAAQATQVGETSSKEKSSGEKNRADAHVDYDFFFTAKYLVTSSFIVKFNYHQGNNPDYDGKIGTTKVEYQKRREHSYGLGVDWLF